MLALAFLGAAMTDLFSHGTGWWQFFAFGLAPDIALFAGVGRTLERGRLHPRAVRLYNTLHMFWGPVALGVAAAVWLPSGWLAGALAWGLHIALDRSFGYGLRTRDGFQRS
jgi:hypothetical protein